MDSPTLSRHLMLMIVSLTAVCLTAPRADAHNGGILVQLQDGKIVTGLDSESPGELPDVGARVFSSLFRPELYGQELPSFISLASPPAGTEALPQGTNIFWDFLPMTIEGVTSNLFYWDGQGTSLEDVQFGSVPQANVTLGLFNVIDGQSAVVDGAPEMVPGALLGRTTSTSSGLRLHYHDWFLLDDGDGGIPPTDVPEGVYLISMQLRMDGYETSDPIFILPGTYGLITTSLDSLDAAVSWVQENLASTILAGDFNFDGNVDDADYAVWRQQYGTTGPLPTGDPNADGNSDEIITAADYTVWRDNFNVGTATSTASVPEPSALCLIGWGLIVWVAAAVMHRY